VTIRRTFRVRTANGASLQKSGIHAGCAFVGGAGDSGVGSIDCWLPQSFGPSLRPTQSR